jgi:hypothetical protein
VITKADITNQPQDLAVVVGQSATFTVLASGTPPLSYQWRFNNLDIVGATGTDYSMANAQPTNAGSYTVVVTNIAAAVTSTVAVLTVNVPPAITNQPHGVAVIAGQDASFAVEASGTVPLSYQWRFNEAMIAGATETSYSVLNAQPANAGSYTVVVTNIAGTVTSETAILTVVVTRPTVSIGLAGGIVAVSVESLLGLTYTLEYKDPLTSSVWVSLPPVAGTGGLISLQDTNVLSEMRFYRVRCE